MTDELKLREGVYLLPLQPSEMLPTGVSYAVLNDGIKDVYVPFEVVCDSYSVTNASQALSLALDVFAVMEKVVTLIPTCGDVKCVGAAILCTNSEKILYWKNTSAVRFFGNYVKDGSKHSYT